MAVFKVEKNKNYTTMLNYHFRDKMLSWKAKGILSTMLSLPSNWDYSLAGLCALSTDGERATRSAIRELEERGYLTRKPIRGKSGKIEDWEYTIYENPLTENPNTVKPLVRNALVDNALVETPLVDNAPQLNTNILSTKELKTKINILSCCEEIIAYLNEKTHKQFSAKSKATQRLISARLEEGYSVEDFKTIVDNKVDKWISDEKMQQYLRPETLFAPKHFESYLNEGGKPKKTTVSDIDFLIAKGYSQEWVMELSPEERKKKREKLEGSYD